ncbi:MAG: bifunctional UDP-N-acetylglucosamine diphosphorylase/glucosamine-1-phosphate N-acetyltransferase GlmU [candidate division KSB1 bacterium]|nr:bifunctional UDP-N-acetylglucosamine diphosphorylase/glucosamine-1-phosphate N-acetyltransferase GlmU [candidate division KSB1 bacterium]
MSTLDRVAAVVLAAGRGTRMRTRRPKVLQELAGEPLITYPLRLLRELGAEPVIVVVPPEADELRAVCRPFSVEFAVQDEPRGTGDAVRSALPLLGDHSAHVLILPADLPLLQLDTLHRLIAVHRAQDAALTILTQTVDNPAGFGRVVRDKDGQVLLIREHRDATDAERAIREVNVGVYCARGSVLQSFLARLRPDNAQGELYFTDVVAFARAAGLRVAAAKATSEEVAQVSDASDLAHCQTLLRQSIARHWMLHGVIIVDPTTAYIGPLVELSPDVVIGPNVILYGRTVVGEGTRFDGCARIANCRIGPHCHVKFGVVMEEAELADEVVVGPFAQLRPGTRLGPRVHIGDFVETKNAVLAAGVKANHLAYLGDVEVGEGSNIGAGTITCNYDGFRKYKTIIGARVQIGSDSQLVAPVTIGDDAYVATGTTVRKDVSPGALVYNPKPQKERLGWVAARRSREAKKTSGEDQSAGEDE